VSILFSLHRPFVADHFHDLPGFVEERHGHNWDAEATFAIAEVNEESACAAALDAWVAQIDYTLLNAQASIQGRNPTTELVAQWLFQFLEARGLPVARTRVREKANYWAACAKAGAGR
jgi:6-pyruvoyl-tetrahydropterin synthase